MGRYTKGILGAFRGKVGSVIGSSWRGIDYMRSLPSGKKNRIPSEDQLKQQLRFGLITKFLSPVRPLLEEGFKNYAKQQTGYNSALAYNLKNGITGIHPDLEIDCPMISFSRGDLIGAASLITESVAAMIVAFDWADNSGQGSARITDETMLLVYSPELEESAYSIGSATRTMGTAQVELPPHFSGKTVHTWIAFRSVTGKEISSSQYAGTVDVM